MLPYCRRNTVLLAGQPLYFVWLVLALSWLLHLRTACPSSHAVCGPERGNCPALYLAVRQTCSCHLFPRPWYHLMVRMTSRPVSPSVLPHGPATCPTGLVLWSVMSQWLSPAWQLLVVSTLQYRKFYFGQQLPLGFTGAWCPQSQQSPPQDLG